MPRLATALVGIVVSAGLGGSAQIDVARADAGTLRLPPSAFPNLPATVRADLEQRGCTVPQPFVRRATPENVIRGRFLSATSSDIAVLCSKARHSAILVYPHGTVPAVAGFARFPDVDSLQVVDGAGGVGYSRLLSVARPDHIRLHNADMHVAIDHDGIENAFIEKGSTIWYWSGRTWAELNGSD
jgi:hypothetical protein